MKICKNCGKTLPENEVTYLLSVTFVLKMKNVTIEEEVCKPGCARPLIKKVGGRRRCESFQIRRKEAASAEESL